MYQQIEAKTVADQVTASRVDMLIAIYDAAIESTRELEATLRAGEDPAMARLRALTLVNLIESGLDLSKGDIPQKVKQLCQFVEQTTRSTDPEKIAAATRILGNLREAFSAVKPQAVAMEQDGSIPSLAIHAIDTVA